MEGKRVYPIVVDNEFVVRIPDLEEMTEGESLADAMEMARDLIGVMSLRYEEKKKKFPEPSEKECVLEEGERLYYIDIDFDEYKAKYETKLIRKNVTVPYNLNVLAEAQGINFSQLLRDALIEKLGLRTLNKL